MRTSFLSRSVVAVATMAIGSVALAAVPATAATPSGITREQVLAAASGVRTSGAPSAATIQLLESLARTACNVDPAKGETVVDVDGDSAPAGPNADGLLVSSVIIGTSTFRFCEFGAVAVIDPSFTLTGTSTIAGQLTNTPAPGSGTAKTIVQPLSGDAFVTAPIDGSFELFSQATSFSAGGNAAKTTTTSTKVTDKKTKSEKKAAKKKYDKKLKALKKSYKRALDKAGSSTTKKKAAKKSYAAKKAAAKTRYRAAIADFKIVKRTTTENRPFAVSGSFDFTA